MDTSTTVTQEAIENTTKLTARYEQLKGGCCVVNVIVSGACGETALPKVKIELDGTTIDSNSVKGSRIQWFPKKPLNFVSKHNQKIARALSTFGVRWGDMTIVPSSRLAEFQEVVQEVAEKWEEDLNQMIDSYDVHIANHQAENPEIKDLISQYALQKAEFRGRFKLTMLPPIAFTPIVNDAESDDVAADVLESLYLEISKSASDFYDKAFFDKQGDKRIPRTRASQKIRAYFRPLIDKLKSLSFLDNNINNIIESTEMVLNSLPKTGWIEGNDLSALARWNLVMADPAQLKAHSSQPFVFQEEAEPEVVNGDEFESVLGELDSTDIVSMNLDEELSIEATVDPVIAQAATDFIEAADDFGFGF